MSAPANSAAVAEQLLRHHARHVVARRDEAEQLAVPQRAFADRVDVAGRSCGRRRRSRCRRADRRPGRRARQLVARTNARGEHDHVGVEMRCRRRTACGACPSSPSTIAVRVLAACAPSRPVLRSCCAARGRRLSSTCTAIRRGANSTTCVCRPMSRSAFAHSRPSSPPPTTVPVFERAPHSRIASRSSMVRYTKQSARSLPGTRRHERIGAGREHQLVVSAAFRPSIPSRCAQRDRSTRPSRSA